MIEDEFLCFAYGCDMSLRRLRAAGRAPTARAHSVGWIDGHRLDFDKLGGTPEFAFGLCDSTRTGDLRDRVYGVLCWISEADMESLHRTEARARGYRITEIDVRTEQGVLTAVAYVAREKRAGLQPLDWYLQHVLRGAREAGLPAHYIGEIARIDALGDPDSQRAMKELSIYRD